MFLSENYKTKGFTLLELLIVASIIGFLAFILLTPIVGIRQDRLLEAETHAISSIIREARTATVSSVGDSQYGVEITEDSINLFNGTSTSVVRSYVPDPMMHLVLETPTTTILFERLTGSATATTTFFLVHRQGSGTSTFTVARTGLLDVILIQ